MGQGGGGGGAYHCCILRKMKDLQQEEQTLGWKCTFGVPIPIHMYTSLTEYSYTGNGHVGMDLRNCTAPI